METLNKINFRQKIFNNAESVFRRGSNYLAIDVSPWGCDKPFSEPESTTIYRNNLFELSSELYEAIN